MGGAMRIDRYKVRQQMAAVGIRTFSELATKIGVSKQALSGWFSGAAFSSQSLEALCLELECTPNDILTFDTPLEAPKELALAA
jgi:DNA-binding Xre family transcriptional regulator